MFGHLPGKIVCVFPWRQGSCNLTRLRIADHGEGLHSPHTGTVHLLEFRHQPNRTKKNGKFRKAAMTNATTRGEGPPQRPAGDESPHVKPAPYITDHFERATSRSRANRTAENFLYLIGGFSKVRSAEMEMNHHRSKR